MLEQFFETSFVLDRLRGGPSGRYLDGFAAALQQDGYSWWTARLYLRSADHLGRFLKRQGIAIGDITERTLGRFRRHLRCCRCPEVSGGASNDVARGARHFVEHLHRVGVAPDVLSIRWPRLVAEFRDWLCRHRGLAPVTVRRYSEGAVALLQALGNEPARYEVRQLRTLLLKHARQHGSGSAQTVASAWRAFLRYLAATGRCRAGLEHALPAIAGWRLASLPRCLSCQEIERIVGACGGTAVMGARDRAIILLLARLALRASDVSALRLTDFDWNDGSLLVLGKGRYEARLPLPQQVGDAVLAYLARRPHVRSPDVFLRSVAPYRALLPSGVSQIVTRAMHRAKLSCSHYGAHMLRHAAATEMLRRGVPLYEIGSVLRHRSLDMSAYYAKVDIELLKQVAQPWPEVVPC